MYRGDECVAEAEAETPESAVLAARTLWEDDRHAWPTQGAEKTRRALFFMDGQIIGRATRFTDTTPPRPGVAQA